MENKYYTPEIEEFHVGFEYEGESYISGRWIKHTLSEGDHLDIEKIYKTARVKYLDREDIESLGFEELETMLSNPPIYRYGNKDTGVTLNLRNQKVGITIPERERAVGGYRTIFEGTIKNKSELKKLLKQLGI
jgi:hypothetical protein